MGLETRGLTCWMAPRDIPPGTPYPEAIAAGIDDARVLVLLFTAKCNNSPHILREVERAVSRRLPVLNIRLDATPLGKSLQYLMSVTQSMDALDGPTPARLDQLSQAIRHVFAGKPLEAAIAASVEEGRVPQKTLPMNHPPGELLGDRIGPYRILESIGEGGFGVVYLAERRAPMVQRVALKVIKPGMDSKAVIARFEAERQALALMDHPNIARVFDAGSTPAGRPYFVMEYVRGDPITQYCDTRNLTITRRLELFGSVCAAILHAHAAGIIHRDLKPTNILVTEKDGQPIVKVIDFGVAKAIGHTLTERTVFTEQGMLIGTPEYMSPEQAEMGAAVIDVRTDVYSLGVVLYELISGLLPFDSHSLRAAGFDAIRDVIRKQDPPRPSTRLSTIEAGAGADIAAHRCAVQSQLAADLRSELDWIPMKALRKDPGQRYATVADLAKDIRRYLNSEVLEAGPESVTYRLSKFARRHHGPFVAARNAAVKYRKALWIMAIAGTAYAVACWFAVERPKRTIHDYFSAVDAHNLTQGGAWDMLTPAFKTKKWNDDSEIFSTLYQTTVRHTTHEVEYQGSIFNPIGICRALLAPSSVRYRVSVTVLDEFTTAHFDVKEHEDDLNWLRVHDPVTFAKLKDGTLTTPEHQDEARVPMVRDYVKYFTLERGHEGRWLIADVFTDGVTAHPVQDGHF